MSASSTVHVGSVASAPRVQRSAAWAADCDDAKWASCWRRAADVAAVSGANTNAASLTAAARYAVIFMMPIDYQIHHTRKLVTPQAPRLLSDHHVFDLHREAWSPPALPRHAALSL